MKLENPILRGMYPDPSVCCVDGVYYLVCSSFEYAPAVPIFASRDLASWEQIGNVIDRPEQLDLTACGASDGIFAPTIRYHEGRFFMITTCAMGRPNASGFGLRNFFVTATDPVGPWSDPVEVDIEGIDPSLYWEDGACYVQFAGRGEIFQAQIDDVTGEVLDGPRLLTRGCGGRDAEGPHMWVCDGWHYLLLAEGGTREGHRATLMRGPSVWGPFEPCPYGPIMSNADLPREPIQRTGHTDWLVGPDGRDYLVALGVREVKHRSLLGRETSLVPAAWTEDGWLLAEGQKVPAELEIAGMPEGASHMGWDFALDMAADEMPLRVISPRSANRDCYAFGEDGLAVRGNGHTLDDGLGCFWALRQPEFGVCTRAVFDRLSIESEADELGIAALITPESHFSLFATLRDGAHVVLLRRRVLDITDERTVMVSTEPKPLELAIETGRFGYRFLVDGELAGTAMAAHLTVENAGTQNTGVVDGIFAAGAAAGTVAAFEMKVITEG